MFLVPMVTLAPFAKEIIYLGSESLIVAAQISPVLKNINTLSKETAPSKVFLLPS